MSGRSRTSCALRLWALLLLHGAAVTLPGGNPECGPNEYKPEGLHLCCQQCPAGFYVSRHCDVNHGVSKCSPCESESFQSHPNRETSCRPCTRCRADQEMVAECTPTSDRQCQCKSGTHYCDSDNCVENCFRCRRCSGPVIRPCNATHDTVCAPEAGTRAPGKSRTPSLPSRSADLPREGKELPKDVSVRGLVLSFVLLAIFLIVAVLLMYCHKKKGMRPCRWFFSVWKGRPDGPDSAIGHQHSESLLPLNPETDVPAPDMEMSSSFRLLEEGCSAVKPEAGPHAGPSEEPEEGAEPARVALGGSPAAPEQALQTAAPAAPGPQDHPEVAPSLRTLEQDYEAKYFVTDTWNDARTYYEFEKTISDKHWKTFMRILGLKDSDIDICECQNPGNVMEQHHQMLLLWRTQLGREASVFKLFAALHKMQLHMYLENIINGLVAEGILVRRSETSDETFGTGSCP
ncbi:tumor necrosis factor receptor superfamily member 1A-like [Callorhinus ursinus]|uniref:Tumor necrosis factor receptor superfamily member 25-like isoform X1 n=1 Tax=Callorhinus ursinus TaxID=34884 RepID=A0A3Q7PJX7_CALUR|nr:tumor necrosis factor receptor superfamily member 25-like isoform X1 [Callorhinus ursinus]